MKEIIVSELESGQRFDKFLGKYLTGAGRSFLYKMLRKKNIVLNGKKATGSELLNTGDSIKIFFSDETFEKFTSNESTKVILPEYNLDIIYENEDILVINKPSGMLSQKAKPEDVSINDYVIDYVKHRVNETQLRAFTPSIANRLDRNTSGIILAGKTLKGLQMLSKALKERSVDKYYLAIIKGEIFEYMHFKGYLLKDIETNTVKIYDDEVDGADYIVTDINPIKQSNGYSLLKIKLITGKTHQIRATLAHLGYPIVGDRKYASNNNMYEMAKRQMLHSYQIVLNNQTFTANPPSDFNSVMKRLGLS